MKVLFELKFAIYMLSDFSALAPIHKKSSQGTVKRRALSKEQILQHSLGCRTVLKLLRSRCGSHL